MNIKNFPLLIFALFFVVFACKNDTKKQEQSMNQKSKITLVTAFDSLICYENKPLPFHKDVFSDYFIDIDSANNIKYAIIANDFNSFFFFLRKNNQWQNIELDSALVWDIGPEASRLVDINGDGFNDICLYNHGGPYGNMLKNYMLFDSINHTFRVNRYFDDMDEYDKKTGLVRMEFNMPRYGSKTLYKISYDSLMEIERLDFDSPESMPDLGVKLKTDGRVCAHYKFQHGKMRLYKVVQNKTDTTKESSIYFEKTLWKSEY
jgi:hypothetical protein